MLNARGREPLMPPGLTSKSNMKTNRRKNVKICLRTFTKPHKLRCLLRNRLSVSKTSWLTMRRWTPNAMLRKRSALLSWLLRTLV